MTILRENFSGLPAAVWRLRDHGAAGRVLVTRPVVFGFADRFRITHEQSTGPCEGAVEAGRRVAPGDLAVLAVVTAGIVVVSLGAFLVMWLGGGR